MNGNKQDDNWMSEIVVDPKTLNKCSVSKSAMASTKQKRARKQDLRMLTKPRPQQSRKETIPYHQRDPDDPNISSELKKQIIKAIKSKAYRDKCLNSFQEINIRGYQLEAQLREKNEELAMTKAELAMTKAELAKTKAELAQMKAQQETKRKIIWEITSFDQPDGDDLMWEDIALPDALDEESDRYESTM